VSAPLSSRRAPRRTVRVLGKEFKDSAYQPQFALGMLCASEREQIQIHRRLLRVLPGKDIKVLVI
jgi:hypothetical protein